MGQRLKEDTWISSCSEIPPSEPGLGEQWAKPASMGSSGAPCRALGGLSILPKVRPA